MMATHKRRCLENGIDPEIAGMNPVEIMMRAAVMFAMDGDWSKAAQMASMAAPYVVPRLSAVDLNAKIENRDPDDMTLEELSAFIQSARNDNSAEGGAQADRQVA